MSYLEAAAIGICCGLFIGGIPVVCMFLSDKYSDWRYRHWYEKWVKNGSDWTKM